jgi:hypothetical protein
MAITPTTGAIKQLIDALDGSTNPTAVKLIDDTVEHTGPFYAIQALEDAAVDVSECDMSFITDVADFTIPKGATIYGTFASIELDSGKVLAYSK